MRPAERKAAFLADVEAAKAAAVAIGCVALNDAQVVEWQRLSRNFGNQATFLKGWRAAEQGRPRTRGASRQFNKGYDAHTEYVSALHLAVEPVELVLGRTRYRVKLYAPLLDWWGRRIAKLPTGHFA